MCRSKYLALRTLLTFSDRRTEKVAMGNSPTSCLPFISGQFCESHSDNCGPLFPLRSGHSSLDSSLY
jgi:hypothetical protein